jgi:hypothetical protein
MDGKWKRNEPLLLLRKADRRRTSEPFPSRMPDISLPRSIRPTLHQTLLIIRTEFCSIANFFSVLRHTNSEPRWVSPIG